MPDPTLSPAELEQITGGYTRPKDQLRVLMMRGFWRAHRGRDGRVILERGHYEAFKDKRLPAMPPEVIEHANSGFEDAASARRAAALRRVPAWADRDKIESIYSEARRLTAETGVPHHVDHEIPLHGKRVSGLHVETNLRVLRAIDNVRKSNHFEP